MGATSIFLGSLVLLFSRGEGALFTDISECVSFSGSCSSLEADEAPLARIPSEIASLSVLTSFDIGDAGFWGSMPTEIGKVGILKKLDVHFNSLQSKLPTELGQLSATLTSLVLSSNVFSSDIPTELGSLQQLTELSLEDLWSLRGSLPTEIGRLIQLTSLELSGSSGLTGALPTELALLTATLTSLDLSSTTLCWASSGVAPDGAPSCFSICGAISVGGSCNAASCLPNAEYRTSDQKCLCSVGFGIALNPSNCEQIVACEPCADGYIGQPDVANEQCFPARQIRNRATSGKFIDGTGACGLNTFANCPLSQSTRGGGNFYSSDCTCGIDHYYDDAQAACVRCSATRGKEEIAPGRNSNSNQDPSGLGSVDMLTSCACAPGYFPEMAVDALGSSFKTQVCIPCLVGTFKPGASDLVCFECPSGVGLPVVGATSEESACVCEYGVFDVASAGCRCPAGFFLYYEGTTPTCQPCPYGYYKPEVGDMDCVQCPQGPGATTSSNASTSAATCHPGPIFVANGDGYTCPTGAGYYNLERPTGKGNYISRECASCPEGAYPVGGDDNVAVSYAAYCDSSGICSSPCFYCPSPSSRTDQGSALTGLDDCSCSNGYSLLYSLQGVDCFCEAGSGIKSDQCAVCDRGSYQPSYFSFSSDSSFECLSCVTYATTQTIGSVSFDDCFCLPGMEFVENQCLCQAGSYLSTGTTFATSAPPTAEPCAACPGGKYKSTAGNGACTSCPLNSAVDVTGMTSADQCTCGSTRVLNANGIVCECLAGYRNANGACEACPVGQWKSEAANSGCSQCPTGMTTAITGATSLDSCSCPINRYTVFTPDKKGRACADCPTGAVCDGSLGAQAMGVSPGYWRHSKRALTLYKCKNSVVCIGASAGSEEQCREGHTGPLCATCKDGFGLQNSLCFECPPLGSAQRSRLDEIQYVTNVGMITGAIVVIIFIVSFVAWVNIRDGALGNFNPSKQNDFTPFAKIVINYLQLTSFAVAFPLEWPTHLNSVFEGMRTVSNPPIQLKAIDCQFSQSDGSEVFGKFLLYMATVPFFIAVFSLLWGCVFVVRLVWRHEQFMEEHGFKSLAELRDLFKTNLIVTIMIFLFFAHMPLTQEAFRLITCQTYVDFDREHTYLQSSGKVECYTEPHTSWRAVAIFFLCLYSIGIPAFGFSILWFNRKNFNNPAFIMRYGFLFKGFEQRVPRIYWEVTFVQGRKVIIVFLQVYLAATSTLVQSLVATFFIFLCLVVHLWYKPYINEGLDQLEALSLCTTFTTLFGGIFFYIDVFDTPIPGLREGVTATLLLWHSLVVTIVVGFGIHLLLRQLARDNSPFVHKLVTTIKRWPQRAPISWLKQFALMVVCAEHLPAEKGAILAASETEREHSSAGRSDSRSGARVAVMPVGIPVGPPITNRMATTGSGSWPQSFTESTWKLFQQQPPPTFVREPK